MMMMMILEIVDAVVGAALVAITVIVKCVG